MGLQFMEKEIDLQLFAEEAPKAAPEAPEVPKTFTQDEVDKIVQDRLAKAYGKLGAKSAKEFDDKVAEFGKKEADTESRLNAVVEKLAFTENRIDPNRADDVRAWLKYKNQAIDSDTVAEALKTHPEWAKQSVSVDLGRQATPDKANEEENFDKYSKMAGFEHGFIKR